MHCFKVKNGPTADTKIDKRAKSQDLLKPNYFTLGL